MGPSIESKVITIHSVLHNTLIHITIKNPVKETPTIYDNSIRTTKTDSHEHGIGLYSIKKTMEKYYGDLIIQCINNVFILTLSFPLSLNNSAVKE